MLTKARACLSELLRPQSYDRFFEDFVGRKPLALVGSNDPARASILGVDPRATILAAYNKHAPNLTCHALAPKVQPPSACAVTSPDAFQSLIREYHENGFTVRVPEVTDLSPELLRITRALELIVENPVGAVIFWSAAGADAPIHHDEIDIIAIQVLGRKRWYISDDPPTLPNKWKAPGEAPPPLDRYCIVDVAAGDLLYMPRGTAHTVRSTTESIHVSIGFVPVTLRDAIIATLDHLSDLDRPLRSGVTQRADDLSRGEGSGYVASQVRAGLGSLVAENQADEFIHQAMARRRSRMVANLPKLTAVRGSSPLFLGSKVRHNPLAMAHVTKTSHVIDLSVPGEQIYLHLGAEECLQYIISTPEFRIADIPGDVANDVRIALVQRLLASGFLLPVEQGDVPARMHEQRDVIA